VPAFTEVAGEPEMTGALLVVLTDPVTVMLNAGNVVLALPSLTEITMFEYVPTCDADGVPVREPEDELNTPHAGLPEIVYVSWSFSVSHAQGK
jgi:hypothetical protein